MRASTIVILGAAAVPALSAPVIDLYGRNYDIFYARDLAARAQPKGPSTLDTVCHTLVCMTEGVVGPIVGHANKWQVETEKKKAADADKENKRILAGIDQPKREIENALYARHWFHHDKETPASAPSSDPSQMQSPVQRRWWFHHNKPSASAPPPASDPSQMQSPVQRRAEMLGQLIARQLLEDAYLD
ncbi:uncharacterized protein FIBRA_06457 [Fibroporia radiculosa]|uniref:Uncharacterized protein n=1 Tax=Fibroporia radiculosa TaxID=599839 RepID=J4IB98_9APHY|nr:uncharacterized protein FIBRA_06457 [Fibroporia radiculosa]CCM04286.1 predicted protein [Fibroporia radiculosa]